MQSALYPLRDRAEEVVEPDLEICDPHHHLWRRPPAGGQGEPEPYLAGEFLTDIVQSGHTIRKTVYVECRQELLLDGPPELRVAGETQFIAKQARSMDALGGPRLAGIIGHADLSMGDRIEAVLEAHEQAGQGLFRGIRQMTARDINPAPTAYGPTPEGFLATTDFRDGLRQLGARGLVFDAFIQHPQLPEVIELARACPDVPIVLEHLGGKLGTVPYEGRRANTRAAWQPMMADLAQCENVSVKLGAIGIGSYAFGWEGHPAPADSAQLAAAMAPEVHWCIERFGAERCMFESNFPVDRRYVSYNVLWNAFKRLCDGASNDEKRALLHDNAVRIYHLEDV